MSEASAHIRALVDTAHSADESSGVPIIDDSHEAKLMALEAWFDDWAAVARTVITKRSELIALGLAVRHHKKDEPAPAPVVTTPATPAAPAAPAPASGAPTTTTAAPSTPHA